MVKVRAKVAHVTNVDLSLRYLLLKQLQALRQAGYDVSGVSSPGAEVPVIEAAGVRHIPVRMSRNPFTPFKDLMTLWQLWRIFRRERFHIVHTHNPKPNVLGPLAAALANVPIVIVTVHGFYFHEHMSQWTRAFFILLERMSAQRATCILFENPEDLETAIRERICSPEKAILLCGGVDVGWNNLGAIDPQEVKALRENLAIPPSAKVVGILGRWVHEKGYSEFFGAAREVRKRIPTAFFIAAGIQDIDGRGAISPQVALSYGLGDCFRSLGRVEDVRLAYALMDVFVLPSYREGMPRAPMEAAAMGRPLVLSNVRGCRQVVQHGWNGFLVPPKSVEPLAEAIVTLLTDDRLREEMGRNSRQKAVRDFDEEEVIRKTLEMYDKLLMTVPPSQTGRIQV